MNFSGKRVGFLVLSLIATAGMTACSENRAVPRGQGDTSKEKGGAGLGDTAVKALVRSDFKAGEITQLCDQAIAKSETALQSIVTVPTNKRTIANSLLALEDATGLLADETLPIQFMGYVSTNEALRDEGSACEEKVSKYLIDVMSRRPLYAAIKDLKTEAPDEARLLSESKRSFELNGLNLSDDQLAEVKSLRQQLAGAEAGFTKNLNNDKTSAEFTDAELTGTSPDFIASLPKTPDGNKRLVVAKEPAYLEIAMNATSPEARKRILYAWNTRGTSPGADNVKLLETAVDLRRQIAEKLGYQTWGDYRTVNRMAKTGAKVEEFLNGLKNKLAEKNRQDLAIMLDFKKKLDPTATKIDHWDIRYLDYQYKKQNLNLDDEEIRAYFPSDSTVQGLFEVYQTLLSVKFVEVKNQKAWSPDVKLYEIHDQKDGRLIAYFYTDFIPRDGKYGHAAAFSLIQGHRTPDGYTVPVSAIVSNFTPPQGGKPSLLTHKEVETLFHEFGHIMHQTLTRAPFASLSGSTVVQDFVEAPSQMLENWVWTPEILSKVAKHYKTGATLPTELLGQMLKAKHFNEGYFWTRQLYYGLMDFKYHTAAGHVDTTAVANSLYRELFGVEPIEGNKDQASFGHLMGGYDAGYYGYLWSKVYAQDMFTRFADNHLLDPQIGGDYRRLILEQGSMRDAYDLVKEFLGRDPNNRAFLISLGLTPDN